MREYEFSIKKKLVTAIVANILVFSAYYVTIAAARAKDGNAVNFNKEAKVFSLTDNAFFSLKRQVEETSLLREELVGKIVSSDIVEFLESLETLAEEEGVELSIDNIDRVAIEGEGKEIMEDLVLQVTGKGDWNNVYKFLSVLELIPYKTDTEEVRLEKVKDERLGEIWRLNMRFKAVKFK